MVMGNSRKMRKARYKVGDVLQYMGERRQWSVIGGKEIPLIAPGMFVTVAEVKPPTKGYGFIKNDEDGEPLIDHDCDGYNVYRNAHGQGRIIWPTDAKEWKNVTKAIRAAIEEIDRCPSVKYWMVPEFKAESAKYAQGGTAGTFVKAASHGTIMGGEKWSSCDIVAYDERGKIVGVFSIATAGPGAGAFKIVVQEKAQRRGWGSKLLDEATRQGIDIVGSVGYNSFTPAGRDLVRSWMESKLKF